MRFLVWVFVGGSALAFVACLFANALDKRAGLEPEAPSRLTAIAGIPALVIAFLFVAQTIVRAGDIYVGDPCAVDAPTWVKFLIGCYF
jgi:hypothetical protein